MNSDNSKSAEQEIDLLELCKDLWTNKFFILKFSIVGLILGIVIAYGIPKKYTTKVSLAPDQTTESTSGNIGSIAAMAGLSFGGTNSTTLTSPDLFPDILISTPFLKGLFDIRVVDEKQNIDTTLYIYLKEKQKQAWWTTILQLPSKFFNSFSRNEESQEFNKPINQSINYTILSPIDESVINQLKNSLNIAVDKKTGVISLSVSMQSPSISASVASTIISYLQRYVINYRTLKARENLDFTQKLYEETRSNYYKKQQELAAYMDGNIGIVSARSATNKERLQNEADLAYSIYNQMAKELQSTKIKVQDNTPVYTVIEPAVEPLIPSDPNRRMIMISYLFVFTALGCLFVLGKKFLFK